MLLWHGKRGVTLIMKTGIVYFAVPFHWLRNLGAVRYLPYVME